MISRNAKCLLLSAQSPSECEQSSGIKLMKNFFKTSYAIPIFQPAIIAPPMVTMPPRALTNPTVIRETNTRTPIRTSQTKHFGMTPNNSNSTNLLTDQVASHSPSPVQPPTQTSALATTNQATAANRPANSSTSAINASVQTTQDPGATPHHVQTPPVHHPVLHPANPLPNQVITPVNIKNFSSLLENHPDHELYDYLVDGLTNGFHIGFDGPHSTATPKNSKSATEHSEAVTNAICKELERKHTSGPFTTPPFPDLHCSPTWVT